MIKLIKRENPKKPFPKLMKHINENMYVWFEEESTGFVDYIEFISHGKDVLKNININTIKRGFMSQSWDMKDFEDTDNIIDNVLQKRRLKKKRKPFPKLKKHNDESLNIYAWFDNARKCVLVYNAHNNNSTITKNLDIYNVYDFKDTDDELIFNFQGRDENEAIKALRTDNNSIDNCLDIYDDEGED